MPGSARLGGEERHEQVVGVRQAGAFVVDRELERRRHRARHPRPADADAARRLGRRVDRVLEQVDQQLLDLVGVGLDGQVGPALDGDRAPLVEPRHPFDQRPDAHRPRARRRQARQLRVGGHEAAQRLGAGRDDAEAAPEIDFPVRRARLALHQAAQAAGNRLDRRQRVVQLVTEDADEALPRGALLVAQRLAHVGQHHQVVGEPALPERRVPHLPASGRAGQGNRLDARPAGIEPLIHLELGRVPIEQPLGRAPRAGARRRGSPAAAAGARRR